LPLRARRRTSPALSSSSECAPAQAARGVLAPVGKLAAPCGWNSGRWLSFRFDLCGAARRGWPWRNWLSVGSGRSTRPRGRQGACARRGGHPGTAKAAGLPAKRGISPGGPGEGGKWNAAKSSRPAAVDRAVAGCRAPIRHNDACRPGDRRASAHATVQSIAGAEQRSGASIGFAEGGTSWRARRLAGQGGHAVIGLARLSAARPATTLVEAARLAPQADMAWPSCAGVKRAAGRPMRARGCLAARRASDGARMSRLRAQGKGALAAHGLLLVGSLSSTRPTAARSCGGEMPISAPGRIRRVGELVWRLCMDDGAVDSAGRAPVARCRSR